MCGQSSNPSSLNDSSMLDVSFPPPAKKRAAASLPRSPPLVITAAQYIITDRKLAIGHVIHHARRLRLRSRRTVRSSSFNPLSSLAETGRTSSLPPISRITQGHFSPLRPHRFDGFYQPSVAQRAACLRRPQRGRSSTVLCRSVRPGPQIVHVNLGQPCCARFLNHAMLERSPEELGEDRHDVETSLLLLRQALRQFHTYGLRLLRRSPCRSTAPNRIRIFHGRPPLPVQQRRTAILLYFRH